MSTSMILFVSIGLLCAFGAKSSTAQRFFPAVNPLPIATSDLRNNADRRSITTATNTANSLPNNFMSSNNFITSTSETLATTNGRLVPSIQTQTQHQQTKFQIPSYASGVFETFNIDSSGNAVKLVEPAIDLLPPLLIDGRPSSAITSVPANLNVLDPPVLDRDLLPPFPDNPPRPVNQNNDQLHTLPLIDRNILRNSPTTFLQFRQNWAAVHGRPTTVFSTTQATTPSRRTTHAPFTNTTITRWTTKASITTATMTTTTTTTPASRTTITTESTSSAPTTASTTTTILSRVTPRPTVKTTIPITTSTTYSTKAAITTKAVQPSQPNSRQISFGSGTIGNQSPSTRRQSKQTQPRIGLFPTIEIDFNDERVKEILGYQAKPGYAVREDGTVDGNLIPLPSEVHIVAKPTPTAFIPSTMGTRPVPLTIQVNDSGGNTLLDIGKIDAPKAETKPNAELDQSTLFSYGAPIVPSSPTHILLPFNRINFEPQILQPQPFSQNPNRFINQFITTTAPKIPAPLPQPATNADIFSGFEIILGDNQLTTTTEYEVISTTATVPIISRVSFGESTTELGDDYTTTSTTTKYGYETTTFTTERPTEPLTTEPATTIMTETMKAQSKIAFDILPQVPVTGRPVLAPQLDLLPPFDSNMVTNATPENKELALEILPPQISQPSFDLLPPLPSDLSALFSNSTNATSSSAGNEFLPVLDLNPFLPPFSRPHPPSVQNAPPLTMNHAQSTQNGGNPKGNASSLLSSTTAAPAPANLLQSTSKPTRGHVKYYGSAIIKNPNISNGKHSDATNEKYSGGFGGPLGILSPH